MDRTREYGFRDDADFSRTATVPRFHPTFRPPTVYRPFVGQKCFQNVCQNPTLPKTAPRQFLRANLRI